MVGNKGAVNEKQREDDLPGQGAFTLQLLESVPSTLSLLLEHIPSAVALFDDQMRYLACSSRWIEDYRLAGRRIIGRSHYEVFPEIDQHARAIYARALKGETISAEVQSFPRKDGSLDWVTWKIVPWRKADGAIGGVAMFTEVMTAAVESRQEASSLAAELNLLIDAAKHHAIFLLDPMGQVRIWNDGAERLFGWKDSEIVGENFDVLFPPAARETQKPQRLLEAARDAGPVRANLAKLRKDGTSFVAEVTLSRIDDGAGRLIGFGNVARDTTEEREREAALESSLAQLNSILDTVPDAMMTIGEAGEILSFSTAAETLFGYRADQVVGQNVNMLMPRKYALAHDDFLAHYRETGKKHVIGAARRVPGRRKDGSIFYHEIYVGEAMAGGQRIFTGFVRDLTRRETAERQLREIQAELDHITKVSVMGTMATALAHELNQPLAAVTNYVQSSAALLADDGPSALASAREALEAAGQEALRAGAIVRRLREFISRGDLDRSVVSPRDIADQACSINASEMGANNISWTIDIARDLDSVIIDRVQIQQVMVNLVRNAIEAIGRDGRILISARREGGMVRFRIADNGPGVARETQDRLFEPFATTKPSGMGIGLSICRAIVEGHGGTLWFEPAPDGGALFQFTVPIAEAHDG
jgi:two-component system sensor kinase FixL